MSEELQERLASPLGKRHGRTRFLASCVRGRMQVYPSLDLETLALFQPMDILGKVQTVASTLKTCVLVLD